MTTDTTTSWPHEAYAAGETVVARLEEGVTVYTVESEPKAHRVRIVYERDAIQPPPGADSRWNNCHRCGALTYQDDRWGIVCSDETGCGWRQRYPAGTTHRADGTSIDLDDRASRGAA